MMKRMLITLALIVSLSACSFSVEQFLPQPTQPPTFTPTRVLSPTPTFTFEPTKPFPTFTLTPTMIGYKTPTYTPENTYTPTITLTLTDIYSKVTPFTPTPNVKIDGFASVKTSSIVFYNGNNCDPSSIKFTVQTIHKTKAVYVVLFVRLVSKTSGAKSEWTSITMTNDGEDMFSYVLTPAEIKSVSAYENPWVQYQLVATTADSKEVGRTGIFEEYLTLLRCVPTETPTAIPTPTVLKP